jgi:hypothetical protein
VLNAACRIRWCLTGPFACPLAKGLPPASYHRMPPGLPRLAMDLSVDYQRDRLGRTDLSWWLRGAKLGDMQVTQSRCPTTADAPAKLT